MLNEYTFGVAINSILKEKWINLLSALTIATGLLIASLAVFVVYNIEVATKRLPERFSISVFIKDDVGDEKIKEIIQAVKSNVAVKDVRYISKDNALKELKSLVKDTDYILDGLGENPLPASLEIGLKKEFVAESSVKTLSNELRRLEGIDEVKYGEKFLSSIQTVKAGVEGIGAAVISALSIGVLFVCYSTIKVLFYRRKDEIETMQLLGATKGFIRTPFIIEGGIIGLSGGAIALIVLIVLSKIISRKLSLSLPLLSALSIPNTIYLLPIIGLTVGLIGALIALGRIKF